MRHTDNPKVISYVHEAMACAFGFHLCGERSNLMDSAVFEAEELLAKLEERLSLYIEYSDVNRINRAKIGEMILVSEDTVDCLLQAFDASARLDGKFYPFMGVAALNSKSQGSEVGRFLDLSGDTSPSGEPVLTMDPDTNAVRKLREGPLLDLGGIGKGFALDRLVAHFKEWEFESGLLDSAGSTFVAMKAPGEESGWDLDIGYGASTRTVSLPDGYALASSGELFQGTHVIDPSMDATISPWKRSYAFAETGSLADAASTASLLLDSASLSSISKRNPNLSFAMYSDTEGISCGNFFNQAKLG